MKGRKETDFWLLVGWTRRRDLSTYFYFLVLEILNHVVYVFFVVVVVVMISTYRVQIHNLNICQRLLTESPRLVPVHHLFFLQPPFLFFLSLIFQSLILSGHYL